MANSYQKSLHGTLSSNTANVNNSSTTNTASLQQQPRPRKREKQPRSEKRQRVWNSALAVNYPARALQIRRGDSYEDIRTKSNGKCIALHLPVIPISEQPDNIVDRILEEGKEEDKAEENDENIAEFSLIQSAYEKEYHIPPELQRQLFKKEINKMRRPNEGKASLE
eukprot:11211139-Ditylum_brightwellii.AAC.1